jgi:hypothetical protein
MTVTVTATAAMAAAQIKVDTERVVYRWPLYGDGRSINRGISW